MLYYRIKSVKETIIDLKKNRDDLIFNNLDENGKGCFIKFTFNPFGIIDSITYLGSIKVSYSSIVSLVGLHENYLNELLKRYEIKLVEDIPEFLSENWAMALYHDNFSKLVLKLKNVIHEIKDIQEIIDKAITNKITLERNNLKNIISGIPEEAQKIIETEIILFLYENRNHLLFYHIPNLK